MSYVEEKYLNLLSPRLERFKIVQRNPYRVNFRCPYCGDSKKSRTKARGNVYVSRHGNLNYKCFNCGKGRSVQNFIKDQDPELYKEFVMEKKFGTVPEREEAPVFRGPEARKRSSRSVMDELMDRVSDLPEDHEAVLYLRERMIPEDRFGDFYYVDDVQKVEDLSSKYRNKMLGRESRICLPFYNRRGRLVGLTMRALEDHPVKYLDIRLNDQEKMIYNIDRVDLTRDVVVVEGPIDTVFAPNCVAAGSSDLRSACTHVPTERAILLYDNQPRNREVVSLMQRSVDLGFRHFVWPRNHASKDLNELVTSGECSTEDIPDLINRNTYGGLRLLSKFNDWKRC